MVNPIPEGTHTVTPHLIVRGGDRAIEFYKQAFGAVEVTRMPSPDGSIMHAELRIGDSPIYLAEENPAWGSLSPLALGGSPVSIHLFVPDADASFERAVQAGATVRMPLADQFWGDRYGQVGDPFGHVWSIATHTEDLSPEEMDRRAREAFASMPSAEPEPAGVGEPRPEPEPEPTGDEIPRRSTPEPAARAQKKPAAKRPARRKAAAKKKPVRKATRKKVAKKKVAKKKTAKKKTAKKKTAKKKTAKKKTAKKKTARRKPARRTAKKKTTRKKPARRTAKKKTARKKATKKATKKKAARRKATRRRR